MQRTTSAKLTLGIWFAVAMAAGALATPRAGTLDIYWIDVEGGASTLIVTPQGQSVLMDAGFAGFGDRDAGQTGRRVAPADSRAAADPAWG